MFFVRLMIIASIILLLPTNTLYAQQALVRNYNNTALEIGQAYLSHYGNRCLAIMPTHVAKESGSIAALLKEGKEPLLGESAGFSDLGDDITAADLIGGITSDCGQSMVAVSRAVSNRIKANALASIRSVNADGTIAQLSVTIIDDDGSTFLRVQPTNSSNQLRKGQSGSLLMSGDMPLGMLLSVNARHGVGKVIRLDAMFDKLDDFVSSPASTPNKTTVSTSGQAPKTAIANSPAIHTAKTDGEITSWSSMAIDADHRAINLAATDTSPPWIAKVAQWPVEIELKVPGGRAAIAGIELDGTGITNTGNLPGTVELMISTTENGRRWRSAANGSAEFINGKAVLSTAPSWARHIRLIISNAADGSNTIALYRLRIIPAN